MKTTEAKNRNTIYANDEFMRIISDLLSKKVDEAFEVKFNSFRNEMKKELSSIRNEMNKMNEKISNMDIRISKLEANSTSKTVSDKNADNKISSEDIVNYEFASICESKNCDNIIKQNDSLEFKIVQNNDFQKNNIFVPKLKKNALLCDIKTKNDFKIKNNQKNSSNPLFGNVKANNKKFKKNKNNSYCSILKENMKKYENFYKKFCIKKVKK